MKTELVIDFEDVFYDTWSKMPSVKDEMLWIIVMTSASLESDVLELIQSDQPNQDIAQQAFDVLEGME